MRFVVFDTETDGLLDTLTKIHVLGYTEDGENITTTHDYDEMRAFFSQPDVLFVCHNVVRYDLPAVNHVLGLNLKYPKFVDTLALSWYLEFQRNKHGLAEWGEEFGVPKPLIDDWVGLSPEQYENRVREDVRINWLLWKRLEVKLKVLYK